MVKADVDQSFEMCSARTVPRELDDLVGRVGSRYACTAAIVRKCARARMFYPSGPCGRGWDRTFRPDIREAVAAFGRLTLAPASGIVVEAQGPAIGGAPLGRRGI